MAREFRPERVTAGSARNLGEEHKQFTARFELPLKEGQLYLTRTHPLVESLAAYGMNTALDSTMSKPVSRERGAVVPCGHTCRAAHHPAAAALPLSPDYQNRPENASFWPKTVYSWLSRRAEKRALAGRGSGGRPAPGGTG